MQWVRFIVLVLLTISGAGARAYVALDEEFADPMVLRASDGHYYAFATGIAGDRHVSVSRSADLKTWSTPREAMPVAPKWAKPKHAIWAPHVVEWRGRYYLFFSSEPTWSVSEHMRLGVAVSASPMGPFWDSGEPLDTGDAEENIDAMVFFDESRNRHLLYWGRNGELAVQELSPNLTEFAQGSEPKILLGPSNAPYESVTEAPYVFHANGFFYLFYSGDDCCEQPHYATLVARARSPFGPFQRLDQDPGRSSSVILGDSNEWISPGHNAVFVDSRGVAWMAYHAVKRSQPRHPNGGIRRVFHLERIDFDSGWPKCFMKQGANRKQTVACPSD